MTGLGVTLNRQLTPAEAAVFHRVGLPAGQWVALYAAPLAEITTQVMKTEGPLSPGVRRKQWPWNHDPDVLPGLLAKTALAALAADDLKAVAVAEDWLQTVLPSLTSTVSKTEFDKAIESKRPQIVAALDLLAWHLAKDVPQSVRIGWLDACEQTGVLADQPSTPWPVGFFARRSPGLNEAREVTNDLRSRVDAYLCETTYGTLRPIIQPADLSAMLEDVAVLASARNLGKRIQPSTEDWKFRAEWGDRAPLFQQWLANAADAKCLVTDDVYQAVIDALIGELASQSWESRNNSLGQFADLLKLQWVTRIKWRRWSKSPTNWISAVLCELRNRIECKRFQPIDALYQPEMPTTLIPCEPAPAGAVEVSLPPPELILRPTEAPPVPPPLPSAPVLEVIDPPDYVTIPFAECLRAAAGSAVADAEWAVSAPLLFCSDPAGPQVVFVADPIPDHLWFVGDIHADVLSLENAWQFIRSEARRDGVEPSVVFLGDFIDRGQYDHETLVRLFRLIRENAGRIVVLAGNHDEALQVDEKTGCFLSDVEPAEYRDELNRCLLDANAGDSDAANRVAVGSAAVRFFARCPRALILPDGTLISHGGFPHSDIQPMLRSITDLQTTACIQDFVWLRASRTAPRKLPNRHSRGCEFGANDFADFCNLMAGLGVPIKRMIRGHDHVAKRYDLPARYAAYPVLTINTLGRRLADEYNPDSIPRACVARHRLDQLPTVYRLPIDSAEVSRAFIKR